MYPKELVILVGKHTGNHLIQKDCSYYRFYIVKDGILKQEFPKKRERKQQMLFMKLYLLIF